MRYRSVATPRRRSTEGAHLQRSKIMSRRQARSPHHPCSGVQVVTLRLPPRLGSFIALAPPSSISAAPTIVRKRQLLVGTPQLRGSEGRPRHAGATLRLSAPRRARDARLSTRALRADHATAGRAVVAAGEVECDCRGKQPCRDNAKDSKPTAHVATIHLSRDADVSRGRA